MIRIASALPGAPRLRTYDKAKKVAALFRENFKKYEAQASAEVRAGGPKL